MPRYVIDAAALRRNLEILEGVSKRTGAKILLAQKAFSCAAAYPLCSRHLAGTTASSLFEARHGKENFGGETHVFAPAYAPEEMDEMLSLVDHIVFNSPRQVSLYAAEARKRGASPGLRVNPEVSVATTPAYDPCRPSSRLGAKASQLGGFDPRSIDGLHFHCLCEQGADELEAVLAGFEAKFARLLPGMKWVNFGGGHHITREGYNIEKLVRLIDGFRSRHPGTEIYLEPGEAVALNAGTLEARVLEIQPRGADGVANAILDASAACHMPDVLEMPYTPRIAGAAVATDAESVSRFARNGKFLYRFGGPTCLAGDEIGTYAFDAPLEEGAAVEFQDMAIYTMVKNNTFNGINLPDIVLRGEDGAETAIRRFGYADFAGRL